MIRKFTYYFLLVLIFSGLSKSLAPLERETLYVQNEKVLPGLFQSAPVSLILVDAFYTGIFIKTYYLKFLAFYGVKRSEIVVVRTNKSYWRKVIPFVGLSIFQRGEYTGSENLTPVPPGASFVGDPTFGSWELGPDGQKVWEFYRAYSQFPEELGWADWRPNMEFFNKLNIFFDNDVPFFGVNQEFGPNGTITQHSWPEHVQTAKYIKTTFYQYSKKFLWIAPWSRGI